MTEQTRLASVIIRALDEDDASVLNEIVTHIRGEQLALFADTFIVDNLVQAVERGKPIRSTAARLLGIIADKRAVEPLIRLLRADRLYEREIAAWALGNIGDPRAIEPLLEAVRNAEGHFKRYGLRWFHVAFGKLKAFDAVELLIEVFENDREFFSCRVAAAKALGKIGDLRAFEPLVAQLRDTRPQPWYSHDIHIAAILALGELRDIRAVEPLIKALYSVKRYQQVQSAIVRSLTRFEAHAIEPLISALIYPKKHVRANAAIALRRIGDLGAINPLEAAAHDKSKWVRKEARNALHKLGHNPDQISADEN